MGSSSYDRSFATHGIKVISSGDGLVEADFIAICPISGNATIDGITLQPGSTGEGSLTGATLLDGITYIVPGASIVLDTGSAILYLA